LQSSQVSASDFVHLVKPHHPNFWHKVGVVFCSFNIVESEDPLKSAFGIMFHHFHGENHPAGQGSISADELDQMLVWLRKDYKILNIEEFFQKALAGKLTTKETCLTLDDSLLCQYEIALPVIESHGLTALFNVYSSAHSDKPDPLEIYRYFRSVSYESFDEFFVEFFTMIKERFSSDYLNGMSRFSREKEIYDEFPFYTENDKLFRFFRDKILGPSNYNLIMIDLMNQKMFDTSEVPKKVFMTVSQLAQLNRKGHTLGLHSDSHPTQIQSLSKEEQVREYTTNHGFLKNITGTGARIVAHPCGQYSETTLEILNQLEVVVGFRSSLNIPFAKSLLEIPREDHSNLLKNLVRE
jgi:peptidoglycan/xylan/chitin deacetylase (PgdA/CDA1 family)